MSDEMKGKSERELLMMVWRGERSMFKGSLLWSPENDRLRREADEADAELTRRGIQERYC